MVRSISTTRRRAHEGRTAPAYRRSLNRTRRDAILRLMNELGDLADGDLTVARPCPEDITGRHCRLDQLHD